MKHHERKKISYKCLRSWCLKKKKFSDSNFILFEGAGGIMVPIEKKKTFVDIFKETKLPIILNDTDNIVKYLNNDDNSNKRKYFFWDLLKNEN